MQALGLEDKSHETDDITALGNEYFEALRRRVETVMRSRPAKDWVETLNEAGVPVSTVKFPIEMFEDDQAAANEMFHILEH
ncbi:MAG: hypothetical protein GWN87_19805, partial [Desulfuromonadales bacterium]|nr:hypothetical protein [Desulfuromonadales bacterium]